MALDERLAMRKDVQRVASWCYLTQRVSGGADYLVGARLNLGRLGAALEPAFHSKFNDEWSRSWDVSDARIASTRGTGKPASGALW